MGGPRGTERRRRARVADRLPRMGFVSRSNFRLTEKPSRKSGEISGSPPTALRRGAFVTGAGLARVPRCRPRSTGDVRRARVVRMSDRGARHTRAIAVSHGAVSLPRSALCPTQPPRPLPAGPASTDDGSSIGAPDLVATREEVASLSLSVQMRAVHRECVTCPRATQLALSPRPPPAGGADTHGPQRAGRSVGRGPESAGHRCPVLAPGTGV